MDELKLILVIYRFNTNVLFKLGCGLDFYQKPHPNLSLRFFLGMSDQRLRLCKDTTVDVFEFNY